MLSIAIIICYLSLRFNNATSLTLSNVIPVVIEGAFRTKVESFFINSHVRPHR